MEVNTLVTHKKGKFEGIGCIAKIFKASVNVNIDEMFKPKNDD